MPFWLPERYARNQNNLDTAIAAASGNTTPVSHTNTSTFVHDIHETLKKFGKYEWMVRANQYTYNWSTEVYSISRQQSSEPEDNPKKAL